MKSALTPKIDLKVTRTPTSEKLKALNGSGCNYIFAEGVIGFDPIGFCVGGIGIPTSNWWNPAECPIEVDIHCGPPP